MACPLHASPIGVKAVDIAPTQVSAPPSTTMHITCNRCDIGQLPPKGPARHKQTIAKRQGRRVKRWRFMTQSAHDPIRQYTNGHTPKLPSTCVAGMRYERMPPGACFIQSGIMQHSWCGVGDIPKTAPKVLHTTASDKTCTQRHPPIPHPYNTCAG